MQTARKPLTSRVLEPPSSLAARPLDLVFVAPTSHRPAQLARPRSSMASWVALIAALLSIAVTLPFALLRGVLTAVGLPLPRPVVQRAP